MKSSAMSNPVSVFSMNPRISILNSSALELIQTHYFFPLKSEDGSFTLDDVQIILEKGSSSDYFLVKMLDGDAISAQIIVQDIYKMMDEIRKRRYSRNRPLLVSYFIFLADRMPDYTQVLSSCFAELQKEDLGISITVFYTDSGQEDTLFCSRRKQTQLLSSFVPAYRLQTRPGAPSVSKEIVLQHLSTMKQEHSNIGKISGFSVTKLLVGINIFIWLIESLLAMFLHTDPILQYGILQGTAVSQYQEFWRLFTSLFLHGDIFHLLFNAYFLYICGELVESIYGKKQFLFIYLISGLAGNLLTILIDPGIYSIGASGACLGLGGILFYVWIRKKNAALRQFQNMTTFMIMILFNVFYGFFLPGASINNWAHIGGFLGGILLGILLNTRIFLPKKQ